MITQADINDGRCYWYGLTHAGGYILVKRNGILLKGFKLKDGAIVRDEKKADVVTQIRRRTSKKVRVVKKSP